MIVQVIIDMKAFMSILVASVVLFAIVLMRLSLSLEQMDGETGLEASFQTQLLDSYALVLGEIGGFKDHLTSPAGKLVLIVATVFQVIIMLNLLISVVSDTYDKVQMDSISYDYRSKCKLLRELYNFQRAFGFGRGSFEGKYLRYLKAINHDQEDESDASMGWVGKLNAAKNDQKKFKAEIIEHVEVRFKELHS